MSSINGRRTALIRLTMAILVGLVVSLTASVPTRADPEDRAEKPTSTDAIDSSLDWSLNFRSSSHTIWMYEGITLTATVNHDVGPTPYWIRITRYEGNAVLALCGTGTSCSAKVSESAPGQVRYLAEVVMLAAPYWRAVAQEVVTLWHGTSVKLTATAHTIPLGSTTVITATTGSDVGTGPHYTQIFDAETGQKVATCGTGTTCSATVSNPHTFSDTRKFVAYVGAFSATAPPPQTVGTSKPAWVTWSNAGYTITLAPFGGQIRAVTNKSVTGFGLIEIHNVNTGDVVAWCHTGTTCSTPANSSLVAFVVLWDIAASSNTWVPNPPLPH